jgi:hypothetical protein
LTIAKTTIWNALASFAMLSMGTKAIRASITPPVSVIDLAGVPHSSWISVRDSGARLSRAIAKGYRDDERIPALAVLTSASSAASTTAATPGPASDASAA